MGLRVTPGSVQLVGKSPGSRAQRDLFTPGEPARLEIWELPAHRVLEVVGVARAEGL